MKYLDSNCVQITRVLHAGYIFSAGGSKIIFDPIFENPFSQNCFAFPSIRFNPDLIKKEEFSAIFISHYHDDHCSFDSLNLLSRSIPIYIYCLHDELIQLIKDLGFLEVYSLALDSTISVGPFRVTTRQALDFDVDCIFQIQKDDLNILNVVDSWIDEDTLKQLISLKPWDLILWPFQTMREIEVLAPSLAFTQEVEIPKEWIQQLQQLNPRFLVPSSCQFIQEDWSWYNQSFFPISYSYFHEKMKNELISTEVIRLNPGVSVSLSKTEMFLDEPLPWITPIGFQDVDYNYKPGFKPPSTSEISKNFPALAAEQLEVVLNYCRSQILVKYRSLEPDDSPYFEKQRYWQLSLYDEKGAPTLFVYQIRKDTIQCVTDSPGGFSWLTEVPMQKLYRALKEGEALTTMYVRINDFCFPSEIEDQIKQAEVTEDPLVRCLFTGNFAAYQKAQLARIVSTDQTN